MEKRPELNTLTEQEKDKLIIALYVLVDELRQTVKQLSEEAEQLKGRLGKNSQNSSKPPASDGLPKPAPKSLRKPGTKKSGGQTGHKGHHLEAVASPDAIECHTMTTCERCGNSLANALSEGYEERQAFDIPAPRMEVTAHHGGICF